jgi:hypothetical protein
MLDIISQFFLIKLLPFKNHTNHGKLILFPSYECQTTYSENLFDPVLNFGFNLGHLKM